MKILLVSNTALYGGAEVHALKVARELTRRGLQVHVIACRRSKLVGNLTKAGVSAEPVDLGIGMGRVKGWIGTLALLDPYARQRLRELLRDRRRDGFDCLVCQDPREQILASRYAKQLGYRVVWIIHSPLHYPLHRIVGYKLLGHASAHADSVVAVCQYLRDKVIAEGIPEHKLRVIPNFVDLDRIDDELGRQKSTRKSITSVAYVGRLARAKGVQTLLRAISYVVGRDRDIELVIAGSGPMESHLKQLTLLLGVRDRVHFLGFVDNPVGVMAQVDVVVNASYDPGEALPTNILEAFAVRRPVVATDHAGIPEVVKHGETGLLVPIRDAQALAEGLVTLIEKPHWARALGERGRDSLAPQYTMTSAVDHMVEVLAT